MTKTKSESVIAPVTVRCMDCGLSEIKVLDKILNAIAWGTQHNKETGHRVQVTQMVMRTTMIKGEAAA